MIVFTLMYPEKVRKLGTWCIVGGNYSSMTLAAVYILSELRTVRGGGIEAVTAMPASRAAGPTCARRTRATSSGCSTSGSEEFERVMTRWLDAFIPKPNEAIPGVPDYEFAEIKVPTLIVRGGEKDYDHPKRTSFEVNALIKGSRLIEPPWPEDAWEAAAEATGGRNREPVRLLAAGRPGFPGLHQRVATL